MLVNSPLLDLPSKMESYAPQKETVNRQISSLFFMASSLILIIAFLFICSKLTISMNFIAILAR